jgi:hypothetical protein
VDNATRRPAGTPATPNENTEISEGDVIRVDSQLVTLNISVIDRSTNRGLMGLKQSDFKLFEDGREQRIVQFDSASSPFDLVLLIDLSGSTREVVKLIRAACVKICRRGPACRSHRRDNLAGEPRIVSELTCRPRSAAPKNRNHRHRPRRHQTLRRYKLRDGRSDEADEEFAAHGDRVNERRAGRNHSRNQRPTGFRKILLSGNIAEHSGV